MAKLKKSPAVKVRSTRATPKPAARAAKGKAAKRDATTKPSGKAAASAKPKRTAATPARAAGPKAASAKAAKPAKPAGGKPRASATVQMIQKVAFTLFHVSDAMRARSFYEDLLGFKRGLSSPTGTWTEYDLAGGGCLALFCHPDPAFARPAGGASIAFEVADLDALNERLQAQGVTYQGDVVHGPNCRMSNILDTEGNSIILHQLNHNH